MLAAAAYNFKRMMNKWKSSFYLFFQELYRCLESKLFKIFKLNQSF